MNYKNFPKLTKKLNSLKLVGLLSLGAMMLLAAGCNNSPPGSINRSRAESEVIQNSAQSNGRYTTPLTVGNTKISVAIMRTPAEQQRGLSGSDKLSDEQGMLFAFDLKFTPGFWMKEMKFDLDLIWIAESRIVGITENVQAPPAGTVEKDLQEYFPPQNIDSVLEVNAGWSKLHNVKVGDEIKI